MPSVKWCCLLALVVAGVRSVAGVDDENAVRSYGPLCTSTDSTATCLFKGLLKAVMGYANRRHDVTAAAAATTVSAQKGGEVATGTGDIQPKGVEEYLFEQIQNVLSLFSLGNDLPTEITNPWSFLKSSFLDGRGKKNKNLGPMLAAGVAMIAGTLFPLAVGSLFMLAGKAIMTSLLAITISGILGLKELMSKSGHPKAYAVPPSSGHYSEAQFEAQELSSYRAGHSTEAKAQHSTAANYYSGGESSELASYYNKASEQQANGSDDRPEYYAVGAGVSPKFAVSSGGNNNVNGNNNVDVATVNNGKLVDRIG